MIRAFVLLFIVGIGIAVMIFAAIAWAVALKFGALSKFSSIYNLLNSTMGVLAGVLLFKEHLTSVNIAGILLGTISIYMIESA